MLEAYSAATMALEMQLDARESLLERSENRRAVEREDRAPHGNVVWAKLRVIYMKQVTLRRAGGNIRAKSTPSTKISHRMLNLGRMQR